MLKSHARFHSSDGKRQILIADDEFVNRELMRAVLQEDYELLFATNGKEALEITRENKDTLSVILLDLIMPVMNGVDMLKEAKSDPEIAHIPVIVISADQDAEVKCFDIGAIDFIPKPYPKPGVIKARILRTIELSEDRQIIDSTERDEITGLYNREYFYRYTEQFDQHHKQTDMDAIVVDVNHFHMINERFGTAYGDVVLHNIGQGLRTAVAPVNGFVCRKEADTFLVYCPHGLDYEELLEAASAGFVDDAEGSPVWLRMGVYAHVDKSIEVQRRFDRAKVAADTVQGSFTKRIGIYDRTMHEREIYAEQLIDDFEAAIRERQFKVYYQPKFDVQPEIPVLASAEALVRWEHPRLGLISPGVFIPLFEDNGLIRQLDHYVWRQTAWQIADWRRRFDFAVPVSVNVSRIDMYDPHLIDTLMGLLGEYGISAEDLFLEITESAYTQDSAQIIETVSKLRALGFRVEMDDFGTGYSSLSMISYLPIDALKLDMQFVRSAFSKGKDTRMLEVIIDIADYLSVPVIAEGVETEEQMIALREMGCDYVQGYYFSRPVPADEYEHFVLERKLLSKEDLTRRVSQKGPIANRESAFGDIAHALSSGFEIIYYVDTESDHYVEFSSRGRREDLQIESSGHSFFSDAVRRILNFVYPDDHARVELSLQKGALLTQLTGSEPFTITYRMRSLGEPLYYTLKAVRARTHDDHHIVIGISNVDSQIREADGTPSPNALNFVSLAQALSADMESIYYVDVDTGTYEQFRTHAAHGQLELQLSGEHFFEDCQRNIQQTVFPDDRERMASLLERETLLQLLATRPVLTIGYRLLVEGIAERYRLRAALGEGKARRHLIMGVSRAEEDDEVAELSDAAQGNAVSYASVVNALAADYLCIYYVNTQTDEFIEYSSQFQYQRLGLEQGGHDFFAVAYANIINVVHPDDVDMLRTTFNKTNVLSALKRDRTFTLTYRLMFAEGPMYVHMKVTRMEGRNDPHIVIGISNIDDQMRREEERARALRMANQDALTGVKSKHAYATEERKIDQMIHDAAQLPFAVAVCDVNGLKQVNDTQGHAAGDQWLRDACSLVCNVFKHSPVFRIGGDEFVAILRGSDYEDRATLMKRLEAVNQLGLRTGSVTVAGGLAEWDPERDMCLGQVFRRADAAMYEDKKRLKESGVEA